MTLVDSRGPIRKGSCPGDPFLFHAPGNGFGVMVERNFRNKSEGTKILSRDRDIGTIQK